MIEPYQWLSAYANHYGYRPEHVGPASVDLCLHPTIRAKTAALPLETRWVESYHTSNEPVLFQPGIFYLCSTLEYITVPPTHCALVQMRSSLARKGLGHKMAGFVDPGFHGQITLELETAVDVTVHVGERIVQLVYIRLTEETIKPYQGHYNGQQGPTFAYKEH